MKKETWSILSAVIAILLVCMLMAFTSGCDDEEMPLEVGQPEKITITGRPEPDIPPQWGKGDIVTFPVIGERPSYSIYETKTLVRTNDLNGAIIELAPYPPGPWQPLGECQYCGRSFRGMTEQEMWRHGDTCPGLLDADHTGTTPVWGKGDLSSEHIKFFGESNGSRLDFMQNQAIDRHTQIIIEIAKRILILEGADPNDVRLGGAG